MFIHINLNFLHFITMVKKRSSSTVKEAVAPLTTLTTLTAPLQTSFTSSDYLEQTTLSESKLIITDDNSKEATTIHVPILDTNEQIQTGLDFLQPKKRGRKSKKDEQIANIQAVQTDIITDICTDMHSDEYPNTVNCDIVNSDIVTDDITIKGKPIDIAHNDMDSMLKTKRRGRKPKDKFKYESADFDEYQKNNKKEDNIVIKLPLTCLKLNEEFNIGNDLFPYNPNITTPKPYNPEHHIIYSSLNDDDRDSSEDSNTYIGNTTKLHLNPDTFDNTNFNKCFEAIKYDKNGCRIGASIGGGIGGGIGGIRDNNNDTIGVSSCDNDYVKLRSHARNTQYLANDENFCNKCTHCKAIQQSYACDPDSDVRQIDIILNNKYNSNTDKFNVLTNMSSNGTSDKWPESTDVVCLWCCHTFENTPWGIPYKFSNGKFTLFGNFCTANCSLAYLLNNYKDDETLWEKIALINLFYFKVYGVYKNLTPSYDKLCLKMFGGTLSIDEYRNLITSYEKSYSIEFPPCNTIIPLLEEIYKKTNLNNNFIPVDKNRVQMANTELKLKRSKPIINHKNTLDFCLGGKL